MQALGAVLGARRRHARPLLIGSVKTNIGHLEAAAGIAGLIKVALALQHGEIPPQLHFRTAQPAHRLGRSAVRVPTTLDAVAGHERAGAIGGVSSFGFSGTNAHMVLEQAPEPPVDTAAATAPERLST